MIFGIGELQRGIENDRRRIHELETALLKAEQESDQYKAAWDWVQKYGAVVDRMLGALDEQDTECADSLRAILNKNPVKPLRIT